MISEKRMEKKMEEWERQSKIDLQQFKKDEAKLIEMYQQRPQGTLINFFKKTKTRFINTNSQQYDKLNRLLIYTNIYKTVNDYPEIRNLYTAYQIFSISSIFLSLFLPKKYFSKILGSIFVYSINKNIFDGIMTYFILHHIALSPRMDPKEQQLRNVLEFHYMFKFFNQTDKKKISPEETDEIQIFLKDIRASNTKYYKYRQIQQLF